MLEITRLAQSRGLGKECELLIVMLNEILVSGSKSEEGLSAMVSLYKADALRLAISIARRMGANRILEDIELYSAARRVFNVSPNKARNLNALDDEIEDPSAPGLVGQGALL
ncbi:hypothetical protein [Fimbriimonas ginsengisoli]|uniref:hypothetical protein n=1 Tax=Fimbriimonas ginsengisoli TaxID=1005039 RepID=UPI00118694B4|nr:hypothetical protein [Fimbriimonas ginsengisoli]